MKCLICDRPLKHANQSECDCGESLVFWTTQMTSSHALRQRGLAQAAKGNYSGACVSFLEAALANPADQKSLIDAAKALAHGGCYKEARRLLENADSRYSETKVPVLEAICKLEEQAKKRPKEKPVSPPAPALPALESSPTPAEPPKARQPLLGLGILKRTKSPKGGWLRSKESPLPAIWAIVLQMEDSWQRDWQTIEHWVKAAQETAKVRDGSAGEEAVFHYMLGLAHVQADEPEAAVGAFERCLSLKPPVLNPAVYYLYLHLDQLQNAQSALQRLQKDYDNGEREDCWKRLLEGLSARDEADKLALLRQLQPGKN